MKNHTLRRIAAVCTAVMLLILGLLTTASIIYFNNFTLENCASDAKRLKGYLTELIDVYEIPPYESPDSGGKKMLMASENEYQSLRLLLKEMCQVFNCMYIYFFRVDTERDVMIYYMVAAMDDKDDELVQEKRTYGTEVDLDSNKYILSAYEGSLSDAERFSNEFGNAISYYFPVTDSQGKDRLMAGVDFDVTEVNERAVKYVVTIVLLAAGVLLLLETTLLILLRRKLFAPIKKISMSMNSFDPEKGYVPLKINSYPEIEEINHSFGKMSEDIVRYIGDIRSMADERARASAELNIARRIQIGMVPGKLSLSRGGFELYAIACPAKEVGGDFYDCFEAEGRVYFMIGDISGKGIAAALFMAMTKNILKERLRTGLSPAEALNSANDALCAENPEGMFATVFAAVLDTRTGELRYANAGHTRPLLLGSEKGFIVPDTGMAIGLFEDIGIIDEKIMLRDGEGIFIYTDGITEAVSSKHELFGEQRLEDAAAIGTAEETACSVTGAVGKYVSGESQADDMTLVTVYYRQQGELLQKELPAQMGALKELRTMLTELAGSTEPARKAALACEELAVNIISYSGSESFSVIMSRQGDELTVRLEDGGIAFDPVKNIPEEKDFDDCDTGGMGIRMASQIARSMEYARIGDRNILVMSFDVGAGSVNNEQ